MNTNGVNIAVVGATGVVGREMMEILEERNFPYANLKLLASAKSAGQVVETDKGEHTIEELKEYLPILDEVLTMVDEKYCD